MKVDTNIEKTFSAEVKELFSILEKVAREKSPQTEVFAVGGFIRNSLLGIPSDDIDIMTSTSGKDFAYLVAGDIGSKDPHVIKENPEKSKFLETIKSNLKLPSGKEIEVDFAQARSEVYSDGSRIPVVKPATPEEDAMRRDFTVNTLMYRIYPRPQQIEDFTGRGIKDLISNIIRTPLDPLKTFKDDPLRIFRCIRFSSQLNFNIDPETYKAMSDPSLREEIKQKVSKERIGQEFLKMLKNPNSQKAIETLKETGLLQDIILEAIKGTEYEGKLSELDMNQENPNHKLNLWSHTMEVVKNILEKYKDADSEKKIAMTLAALMHDLGKTYKNVPATI